MYVRVAVSNHSHWFAEITKAEYFQGMPTAFLFRKFDFLPLSKYLKIKVLKIIMLPLCASRKLDFWP
jgi:hypothetical protein